MVPSSQREGLLSRTFINRDGATLSKSQKKLNFKPQVGTDYKSPDRCSTPSTDSSQHPSFAKMSVSKSISPAASDLKDAGYAEDGKQPVVAELQQGDVAGASGSGKSGLVWEWYDEPGHNSFL